MRDLLVLRQADRQAAEQAKRYGLKVVILERGYALDGCGAWDRALFVEPGIVVPWHLVSYGLHFVERWDAAAPLWRYGVLAKDVGTPGERERTAAVIGDLRVMLYAHELMFVRASTDGLAFLAALDEEVSDGGEKRLAFLRAMHRVKPMICTLPASWMGAQAASAVASTRAKPRGKVPGSGALVRIEIAPGRYVRCRESDEAQVRERYRMLALRRSDRRAEEAERGHH